jgi:vanillate O-demethylase monooxygenase subunit
VRFAFEEDRVILQALQIGMDNKTTPNIDIKSDRGPKQFRKHLAELIAQEQAQNVVQIAIKVVSA